MTTSYATLLRIIDLGLLLLMAFFAVADLSEDLEVPLPAGRASEPTDVYAISFDRAMHFSVRHLPGDEVTCRAQSLSGLARCLGRAPQARFLINTMGRSTVQQLVDVLDVCKAEGASCSIAP